MEGVEGFVQTLQGIDFAFRQESYGMSQPPDMISRSMYVLCFELIRGYDGCLAQQASVDRNDILRHV